MYTTGNIHVGTSVRLLVFTDNTFAWKQYKIFCLEFSSMQGSVDLLKKSDLAAPVQIVPCMLAMRTPTWLPQERGLGRLQVASLETLRAFVFML